MTTGWFAYRPLDAGAELREPAPPRPPPTPSYAPGVREVTEEIGDDDLYGAFVEFLAWNGSAYEVEPGVIRVDIHPDRLADPRDAARDEPVLLVHITRAQLREQAWATHDIFDDTDELVVPRTDRPVAVGFDTLTFSLEEMWGPCGMWPGHLACVASGALRYGDDPRGGH